MRAKGHRTICRETKVDVSHGTVSNTELADSAGKTHNFLLQPAVALHRDLRQWTHRAGCGEFVRMEHPLQLTVFSLQRIGIDIKGSLLPAPCPHITMRGARHATSRADAIDPREGFRVLAT